MINSKPNRFTIAGFRDLAEPIKRWLLDKGYDIADVKGVRVDDFIIDGSDIYVTIINKGKYEVTKGDSLLLGLYIRYYMGTLLEFGRMDGGRNSIRYY